MAKACATKRRRVLLIALSGMVVLACFIVKVVLFLTGKPTISVNYAGLYNERLRPAGLADDDNAAADYKDAFARLPNMPDDVWTIGNHLERYDPAGIEWQIVESWLATSDEALRVVQQAARKPAFWMDLSTINFDDSTFVEEMGLTKFRQVMLTLRCKAEYLAIKGDMQGAFDRILTICKTARHMGQGSRIQTNLSQALEGMAHGTAFDLLSKANIDAGLLREFQGQFERIFSQRKLPSFEGDEILLRDAIQRYFTDNGRGDGHLIPKALYDHHRRTSAPPKNELEADAAYLQVLYTAWSHPSRQRTIRTLTYLTESANEFIRQPPWRLHGKGTDAVQMLERTVEGNRFLQMVGAGTALGRTIEIHHRVTASGDALITTMGILRFHAEKGTWPQSLEELAAAGCIRQVPIDPYSGKPLVYRQRDGSFTLYSLGADFDDDGGTRSKWGQYNDGGDQVFWPVEGPTK